MEFSCQKIRGLKFFEWKIMGTESLIDLKKHNPSGFPDLKKDQPLPMKLENQTRTLFSNCQKKKQVYLKQLLLFVATTFKNRFYLSRVQIRGGIVTYYESRSSQTSRIHDEKK